MLIVRAYWLAIVVWVLVGILFIGVLIPTPLFIRVYKKVAHYAPQHCDSNDNFAWAVFGKIIDTLFSATFWTAVATLSIACFTYWLKQSTDRLWKESRKASNIAGEALLKLERPFVFVTGFPWFWRPDLGRPGNFFYTIHPIIENSGNTPTQEMTINIEYALKEGPLPIGFEFTYTSEALPTIIGPKGKITGAEGRILDIDLAAVQAGTKHFYIWGIAQYRDIFENTPVHTTTFCSQITDIRGYPINPRDPDNPKLGTVEMSFRIHPTYNSSD